MDYFIRIFSKKNISVLAVVLFSVFIFQDIKIIFAASPAVTTSSPATSITKTSADFRGSILSNGGSNITSSGFNYGTTSSYGETIISATPTFVFDSKFGNSGTTEGLLNGVYGIEFDLNGDMYVVDPLNHRVQKFNSSGVFISMFGWGVDTGANQFETCTSGCQIGISGSGDGQFGQPFGIATDSMGNFYVLDQLNARVQKFNSSGVYQSKFGSFGATEGNFNIPIGIELDSSDNIYIADTHNHRVQKFNSSGVFISMFGWGVDTGANQFETCTSGCQIGISGSGDGQFSLPIGIAIDSSEYFFVTDYNNNRVQKFDSFGVYQSKFGSSGSGDGQFILPVSIFIDTSNNIYITDRGNRRVQKFNSLGIYESKFGSAGAGDGRFIDPLGIAIHPNTGNIYVTDFALNRIQKFNLTIPSTSVTSLLCQTLYYFQAFAINIDGTSTGSDENFTTLGCQFPIIETKIPMNTTQTTATLKGSYLDIGGSPVITRGFEYGPSTTYSQTFSENGNEYVSQFGVGSGYGIAIDSSDSIYVVDSINNMIRKFNSSGTPILDISGNGSAFVSPNSVYIDSSDNVYITDPGINPSFSRVQKFDSSGLFQLEIGTGLFGSNFSVAVDSSGNIFVSDVDNLRAAQFNALGVYISDFAPFEFSPSFIDFDSNGNVYVVDGWTYAVKKYDSSGLYISDIICCSFFGNIHIDVNDNIYIADPLANKVLKYDSSGNLIYTFGSVIGSGNGETDYPTAVASDSNGDVYVMDTNNARVQKLSLDFDHELFSLTCSTTYHYRSFATNLDGVGYGDNQSFETGECSTGGDGSGSNPNPVRGCTDDDADNYNSRATQDDGSCLYAPGAIVGCTDNTAGNYSSTATVDNGSCLYGVFGCMDTQATNYNPLARYTNNLCRYADAPDPSDILGCTEPGALNYDPRATQNDNSCDYLVVPIDGCMEDSAENYNSEATRNDGSCEYINPPNENGISEDRNNVVTSFINSIIGYFKDKPEFPLTISIAGLVVLAINSIFNSANIAGLVSVPIRIWNIIPTLLGFRRRKRPWGTVYDSVTKQPLDPVYVLLKDINGKEISTSITDLDGRYGFQVTPGQYSLFANKTNYVFPSVRLSGKTEDDLYDNLYYGGLITVNEKDGIIKKNIPMDSINFNWNEFEKAKNKQLMKFYSQTELFLARISKVLFFAGLISSIVLMILKPGTLNLIILALYAVIIILAFFGIKPKSFGFVREKETGYPLSFGVISVFSSELGREVAHTVIGKTGRYYLLVPKGTYFIRLRKKTGEDTYKDIYQSESFNVNKGYINKIIKI